MLDYNYNYIFNVSFHFSVVHFLPVIICLHSVIWYPIFQSNTHIFYTVGRFQIFFGLVDRVFANGPGDLSSIPGCVIPKTLKMILDTSLLNTQHYKVRIKSKVEQSRERNSALPYTIEKGAFGSLPTTVANYIVITICLHAVTWLLVAKQVNTS